MDLKLNLRMIGVMVVITACSGLILAGMWSISIEKIKRNETKNIEDALFSLNPRAKTFKIINKDMHQIYECYNKKKRLISYFFLAQGNGFQAPIKIAVTVDKKWKKLVGIRILEQTDTPGLGAKITEESFLKKFKYLVMQKGIPFMCIKEKASKKKGEIKAITGATISSKAVVTVINDKITVLKPYYVEE
jgi:electron transport complex protein RnfG